MSRNDNTKLTPVHETPLLCGRTSRDKLKYWQGVLVQAPDGRVLKGARYWQTDEDGTNASKVQETDWTVVVPMNVGRTNETHPRAQGVSELAGEQKKKRDKGYWIASEGEPKVIARRRAMLALPLGDEDFEYPIMVQPKYDGVRGTTNGREFWSRDGLVYPRATTEHLLAVLSTLPLWKDFDGELDGELILPHGAYLEETVSAIKSFKPDASPKLMFRLFDKMPGAAEAHKDFQARWNDLKDLEWPKGVILSETLLINSEEELLAQHSKYRAAGWEGTMIRVLGQPYKFGHRSHALLKLKDWQEAEFTIVGAVEGKGKLTNKVGKFNMIDTQGREFDCTPKCPAEMKAQLWQDRAAVIGRQATVRYQALTKKGVPQFGRVVGLRDYAIQGG